MAGPSMGSASSRQYFDNSGEDLAAMACPSCERTPLLASPSKEETMEGSRKFQYLGALVACLSAMVAGTTMGWTSSASSLTEGPGKFKIKDAEFSWVSALLSIGAMIGALPLGMLSNKIGRKKVILFLYPLVLVGYLLLAWSTELWMLCIARVLLGLATGAYCVVTPMYTSEIAEPEIRGVLGSFFQLLMTGGILFVYILSAAKATLFEVNIACACIPVLSCIAMVFFPDSPRWYASKGMLKEAEMSLKFYRGKSNVTNELNSIQNSIEEQREHKLPFKKALSLPEAKYGLFLALGCMVFQQFSGINAVIFYSTQIFDEAKAGLEPSISTLIVGICQIVSTAVSTQLVDRLGRRILLMFSGTFMALSGAVLGVFFFLKDQEVTDNVDLGWLPILCMVVFIITFSLGYGPIPWLYMGEVFEDQIKEAAMAVATVVNWFSVFVVTKFYKDLTILIGTYSTFWIFSGISVVGVLFVFFGLIETKGIPTEEVVVLLGKSPAPSASNGTADKNHNGERF